MRLIDKELNVAGDWKRITRVLNAFIDDKDKMLGTLNIQDPAAMMKRLPALLKDWASLSFMGKVIFAALPDAARPIMNNGFKNIFKKKLNIRTFLKVFVSPSACNNELRATTEIKIMEPENITLV